MAAPPKKLTGFTLIELLITITILALVIGLATFGFSLFSKHWDVRRSGFERSSGQLQRLDLVGAALEDAIPWGVRDETGKPGFYFLGRDEGLTLVTGSPVFSNGWPAVIRLFREAEGDGRWRLVYEEAPLKGVKLREAKQVLPFSHRMVVLENLSAISFRYFGWESLQKRQEEPLPGQPYPTPGWYAEYDGLVRIQSPQRIGVTLGTSEAIYVVPERSFTVLNRMQEAQ